MLTIEQLALIAGRQPDANMRSVLAGLAFRGTEAGLHWPHRLAHYLAQLAHESGRFRYDREVWGPTPAQARYDTRTDLGNTPARDGDGRLYIGRTGMQVTGLANYAELTRWCRELDPSCPDFVADPDEVLTDPWEGMAPIWFWTTRNLNLYADRNHIETVTKRINGGLTGYSDRIALYVRAALVLLRYGPQDVKPYQAANGLVVDGDPGPLTRAALHKDLAAMVWAEPERPAPVQPAASTAEARLELARPLVSQLASILSQP